MNSQNLIPNSERTPSERKEIAKKGGKKSGEVRAKRKTFKELFQAALSAKSDDGLTEQEKIVLKAIEVAKATGNYKDIEATIGEKPTERIAMSVDEETMAKMEEFFEMLKDKDS